MIKRLLLGVLLILTMYSGFRVLFPSKEENKLEITIPKGKEKVYKEIVKKIKQENSKNLLKTKITEDTYKSIKKVKKKEITASKNGILIKIKEKRIVNNELIISIYLWNKNSEISKKFFLNCNAIDKNNNIVDSFSWSGKLRIKQKKTLLLKDINLGYINARTFNELKCYIK